MKKAFFLFSTIVILLQVLTGCSENSPDFANDAEKFKYEYESLNGKMDDYAYKCRSINISVDNPMVYSSYTEIAEKMDEGKTFAAYFGFAKCPWCRGCLEALLASAKECGISTIYYVDVYSSRDQFEIKNGLPEKVKDGEIGYDTLLEKMQNVLSDYTLSDSDGNEVSAGEKRIYAPNLVIVKDGTAVELAADSELFTDPYGVITDEITHDMKTIYINAFSMLQ